MVRDTFASIESTAAQAESLAAQGRYSEAELHYRDLIGQTHVIDYEYDDWLRRLADVYGLLERRREAGYIYLYLHYFDLARDSFPDDAGRVDRARVLEVEKRWQEAALAYDEAKLRVHAGVAFEKSRQYRRAAEAWESLLNEPALRERPYELALAHFNYGMACTRLDGKGGAGKRALIDSQRRLEQVADDFETRGERERAFDCYQILLKLGKESGSFENLAEGYINCIRVLRDDNLKFYVLQYYEDFIKLALQRGELHAASTLYQEAADYAARTDCPTIATISARPPRHGSSAPASRKRMAPRRAGRKRSHRRRVLLFVDRRLHRRVSSVRKTQRPAPDRKETRSLCAYCTRYSNAVQETRDAPEFPEYLKQQHAYADIWFVDLLEWELGVIHSESLRRLSATCVIPTAFAAALWW